MKDIKLQDLVGGALQEAFAKSFEKVIGNMQDVNTPFKTKRSITITLGFEQNELRDDVKVSIDVKEKLAPQAGLKTSFSIGTDLKTGELYAEEYGRHIKGQVTLDDYQPTQEINGNVVDTDTGEIIEQKDTVVDFRKAATN